MIDYQLKKPPNYLYLIKIAIVLGSELCGVALRGRAIIEGAGFDFGSFRDFCFLCIYFFLLFFFTTTSTV